MFNRPSANGGKISTAAYQYSSDNGATWQGPFSVGATSDPVIIVVTKLTPGKTYKFKVAIASEVGWSPWAEVGSVTLVRGSKPAQPTGGTASASGLDVTLSWNLGSVAAGSSVKIFMQQIGSIYPRTIIKTVDAPPSNFTTNVRVSWPGRWCFEAQVVDSNGCESALSDQVCVTVSTPPDPPGTASATITDASDCTSAKAIIKFARPNGNGGTISTAAYLYSSDNGATWQGPFSVGADSDPIQVTVPDLTPGKTYKFKVAIANQFGWSPYADVGSITFGAAKKPAAPTNGTGSSKNLDVTLSWTVAASAAGATVKIFSQQGATTAPKTLIKTVNAAGTTVTATATVGASGTYSFYAQVTVAGCESDLSAPITLTVTNVPQVVPGTPTKPVVTSGPPCESANTGSVTVTSNVTNAGPPITQYEYQTRRLTSIHVTGSVVDSTTYSAPSATQSAPVNDPASADGGPFQFKINLDDGQYQVRVRAVNSVGPGSWSAWGVGPTGPYGVAPGEAKPGPFTLSASVSEAATGGGVDYLLTWTTPSVKNINRGAALVYHVYLLKNGQNTKIFQTSTQKTYTYKAGSSGAGGRFYVIAFSAACSSQSNFVDASTLYWKCSNPATSKCAPTLDPAGAYPQKSDCITNCDSRTCGPGKYTDGDCVFEFSATINNGKEDEANNSTREYTGKAKRKCVAGTPQYSIVTPCAPVGGQPGDCGAIELRSGNEECIYSFPLTPNGKTKTAENTRPGYTGTKIRYCKDGKSTYESFKECRAANDTSKQCKPSVVEFGDCTFHFNNTINLNSVDTVKTNTPGFAGEVRRTCENNGASYEIVTPCSPLPVPGKSCSPINITTPQGCSYSFPAAADGSLDFLSTTTPGRSGKYSRWCNNGANSTEEVEPCVPNPNTAVCPPELVGADDCVYDFTATLNPGQSDVVDTSTPGYVGKLRRTCFIGGEPGYTTVIVCAKKPGKSCDPVVKTYKTTANACDEKGKNWPLPDSGGLLPCDCRWVSPTMTDGQSISLTNETPGFEGYADAICNDGVTTITPKSCNLKAGTFCKPPTIDIKFGACKYTITKTLLNGEFEIIENDKFSLLIPTGVVGVIRRNCVNGNNDYDTIEPCHPERSRCPAGSIYFPDTPKCTYSFPELRAGEVYTVNSKTNGWVGTAKRTCTGTGGIIDEPVKPCINENDPATYCIERMPIVYGRSESPTAVGITIKAGIPLTLKWLAGGINYVPPKDSRYVIGGLQPGGRASDCKPPLGCGKLKVLIGGVEVTQWSIGAVDTTGYNGALSLQYIDDAYKDNDGSWTIGVSYGNCGVVPAADPNAAPDAPGGLGFN
jgi:hypothetical protein